MSIQTTQLAMGYSRAWATAASEKPTCSACGHRFVTTEQQGTFQAGSLKCTKGGFMTAPLARCNDFTAGPAKAYDPAVQRARLVQIGPTDVP